MPDLLLRSVRFSPAAPPVGVPAPDGPVDVLVRDGRVAAIGAIRPAGGEVLDLDGRFLLPGLWDNHVHADQWALSRSRLDLSTATSAREAAGIVAAWVEVARVNGVTGTLVGSGFRDALWPDAPHRDLLDAVTGDVPAVLVSNDLHCGWLNTPALHAHGLPGHPTGLVRETEFAPIREAVRDVDEAQLDAHVAAGVAHAATRGVVGVVDFEAPWNVDHWARRIAAGTDAVRVVGSVWPERLDEPITRGLRTGDVVPGTRGLLTMGPLKVIADGSLNTRTAYCHDPYPGLEGDAHPCGMLTVPFAELQPLLARATAAGIDAALHAIGDRTATVVLDAFAATGARGRVEHAQLLTPGDVVRFGELGVSASVQPAHVLDDRDVADRFWAGRTARAFPYRTLLDAGVPLHLGSDAPVAPLDPWTTLAAAVHRSGDDRPSWHPEQEIPLDVALAASAGPDGPLRVGRRADLVVVDRDPATATPQQLRTMPVAATLVDGRTTWSR